MNPLIIISILLVKQETSQSEFYTKWLPEKIWLDSMWIMFSNMVDKVHKS